MNPFSDTYRYDHALDPIMPLKVEFGHYQGGSRTARPDMHYEVHLGVVIEGQMGLNYPDFQQLITRGNIWFTAPWEPHFSSDVIAGTQVCLLTILPDKIGDTGACSQLPWLLPFIVSPNARPQVVAEESRRLVLSLVESIREVQAMSASVRQSLLWLKCHELLGYVFEANSDFVREYRQNAQSLMRIQPAIELVRKAKREPVSLDQAAEVCQLGVSRFSELFRGAVGISFGKFSLRVRLSGALADVRNSSFSYKEIAENWGFFDQSHFYRAFRQHLKCSPREIRHSGNGHLGDSAVS